MIFFPVIYTWMKIALFKLDEKNHSEDKLSYV